MKEAVVGSRMYPRPDVVAEYVWGLVMRFLAGEDITLVSGGAPGVDSWAAWIWFYYAGHEPEILNADWRKHGKAAGVIRNTEVVRQMNRMSSFWDGKSRGTKDAYGKAMKVGKPVQVFGPDGVLMLRTGWNHQW